MSDVQVNGGDEKSGGVGLGVPSENVKHYPVGTLMELESLCRGDDERFEVAKRVYATCSMPSPESRGCPFYKKCEFKKKKGVSGPHNYGVLLAILNGAAAIRIMSCFLYMAVVHPIRRLSKSQAVKVVAFEGDIVKVRQTSRVNPKDPKDVRHKLSLVPKQIPLFPRPDVSMAELAFSMEVLKDAELQRIRDRDETIMRGASFVGQLIEKAVDAGETDPDGKEGVELS